jgi:hypothetical protein
MGTDKWWTVMEERGNDPLGSINCGEFLDWINR